MKKTIGSIFIVLMLVLVIFGVVACDPSEHVHSLVKHDEKAATCTTDGNILYWECTSCHKFFTDNNATNSADYDELLIPALGHDAEGITIDVYPTFEEEGSFTAGACSRCDYSGGSHTLPKLDDERYTVEDNTATCTAAGEGTYSITVDEILVSFTAETKKLAHTFDRQVAEAKYKASDATCEHKATYYYSCVCGEIDPDHNTFEYGELESHTFDRQVAEDKYLASPATCEHKATYYYSCSVCGEVDSEHNTFEYGDLADHTPEDIKGQNATCSEPGLTDGVQCSVCGEWITPQNEILATGEHELQLHEAQLATEAEDGNIKHYTCATCGKYFLDSEGKEVTDRESVIIAQVTRNPDDEGVLADHVYEAEAMATVGNSSDGVTNFGHLCVGKSFQFDPAFSGNIAVKNYTGITLILTVESTKDVCVMTEMRISNLLGNVKDLTGTSLSELFTIVAGSDGRRYTVNLVDTIIPGGGEQITDSLFFRMVTVSFELNLFKGTNTIEIHVTQSSPTNMDYINIKTSEALGENQTSISWLDDDKNVVEITKVPTATDKGTIKFDCTEGHGSGSFATLPELTSELYNKVNEEGVDTYYITISGKQVKVSPVTPEFIQSGDGKINFGSGGFNLFDNRGVYSTGTYTGNHWKMSTAAKYIGNEKATVFTFGSVSSVIIDTDSTGNSKTGGFFRTLTKYSRENATGKHYSYEFTFTFRNYGAKSLQFETYFRYGSADTLLNSNDITTVTLAPAGESGDTVTVVIKWTDSKDGTDGNLLTYFRNFVYGGTAINSTESLDLLNGVSFGAYAFVKNLGVKQDETTEHGTKINFAQGLTQYDNNGSYTAGKYTGNHWKTSANGANINGTSAALISFGSVSDVTIINDNSNGYSKTGAFFRVQSPYQRSGSDTYTFTFTFANYSDKSLEFEVYFRHGGGDTVLGDGDITKISLAPMGQAGDTVTVTITWTDKKGGPDANLLTYFRNFAVGGIAINSADTLQHLEGVSFGALLYGKVN